MQTKQRTRVIGYINPDGLYTTEGCMRFAGLGRMSLLDARASKLVKPLHVGNRAYYRGRELIEWILSLSESK